MWQWMAWSALVVGCVACADNPKAPPRCGNDILDPGEACDGALIASDFSCGDGQQPIGCNACVPECPPTPSACGNGVLDDGEECDGANVPACPTGMVGNVTCSATCEPDMSACVPEGGQVTVHVVQGAVPEQNAYVVSHKPDGSPLTECFTDAAGMCVLAGVPDDAMITIGFERDMGVTITDILTTFTHVTPPQTIEYDIGALPPGGAGLPAYVALPGPYAGATSAVTMNGCGERTYTDFTTLHDDVFGPSCIDANQQGVVYAEARDGNNVGLAWSYLRQSVMGTPTFTLPAWSTSFSAVTAQMTNVPSTTEPLAFECTATVDNLVSFTRRRSVAPPAATETFAVSVPSGVTTHARCSVTLGLQQSSQFCERRQSAPFTTLAFDGNDLLPPLTSTFTVDLTKPLEDWTCTLASQPTPNGDVSDCFKGFARGGTPSTHIGWHLVAPGDFIGTLKAPRLGPSFPFPTVNVEALPGFEHANRNAYSDVTGYSDYLDGRVEPVVGERCAVFHNPQ